MSYFKGGCSVEKKRLHGFEKKRFQGLKKRFQGLRFQADPVSGLRRAPARHHGQDAQPHQAAGNKQGLESKEEASGFQGGLSVDKKKIQGLKEG